MDKFLLPFERERVSERRFSTTSILVVSIVLVGLISTITDIFTIILVICGIFAAGTVTHTRWRIILSLVARLEIPVLFWLFLEPFLFGETIVAVVNSPWGPLPIYREGILLGIMLVLRIFAVMMLFMGTLSHMTLTEFTGTLRTLGVPTIILGSLLIMLRYVPLFREEQTRMMNAQTMRGLDVCGRRQRLVTWGSIVGATIVRAMDRSQSVYQSMSMRGSTGNLLFSEYKVRRRDALLLLPVLLSIIGVLFVAPIIREVLSSWIL